MPRAQTLSSGPSNRERRPPLVVAIAARDRARFIDRDVADRWKAAYWATPGDLRGAGWRRMLERENPEILVTGWMTPPLAPEWLASPDCRLRYVCHIGGTVRQLVPREFVARGGLVSNWGPSVAPQVAEHALLLALAALRRLPRWRPFLDQPEGRRRIEALETRTLFGCRVGLHGFGAVARALCALVRPFGVTVSAYTTGVAPAEMRAAGVAPCRTLGELFARSDVLFECEALTPATDEIVDAAVLGRLPAGAVFVNVGRGRIVRETDLIRVARARRLRVALDVVADEPMPRDAALLRSPDIVVSPHIAGPTADQYFACGRFAADNIRRYLTGREPQARVTPAIYDRST
ncbi:MAG TPA: hydroxyacid dehydrogenase [Opitutaceae bacterium]|nr:hydroxyacid dehydrogenase [Opitutaceae bacterium]